MWVVLYAKTKNTKYISGSHLYKFQNLAKPCIAFIRDVSTVKKTTGEWIMIHGVVAIFGQERKGFMVALSIWKGLFFPDLVVGCMSVHFTFILHIFSVLQVCYSS